MRIPGDKIGEMSERGRETARVIDMARAAVAALSRDLTATTGVVPPPFEYRLEDGAVRMAYKGQFATSSLLGTQQPAITTEVADFMQDEVVEDLWSAWPVCPEHDRGLNARCHEDRAVWMCSAAAGHVVADIGRLARGNPGGDVGRRRRT